MKGYSRKVLVGVSFASLMLGSFQGNISAEDTKGSKFLIEMCLKWSQLVYNCQCKNWPIHQKCLKASLLRKGYTCRFIAKTTRSKKESKQLVAKTYTIAELNQLSNQQLVDLLVTIDWEQITGLFHFNKDSLAFYQNDSRMQAIIDKLKRGQAYTKDDSKGIETLVEVLRSGFYLGFIIQN